MKNFIALVLVFSFCLTAASFSAPAFNKKQERKYLLERVKCGQKDFAVVQAYADGFEKLTLPDKLQIYYLGQAAVAGNDIIFDQNHRDALKIKHILEEIITHADGIDKNVLKKIFNYAKIFWAEESQYGYRDKMKFMPEFTYDEILSAAKTARKNGANFNAMSEKHLEQYLKSLEKSIFDLNYEPLSVCKDSKKDIVAESAVNFYEKGVTLKDFNGFAENNQLNSLVEKKNGKLYENVYKIGGLYSDYLVKTNKYLEDAAKVIHPKNQTAKDQIKTIQDLMTYFKTGNLKDFEKFNIQWVKTKGNVDFILGFIESYKDPRGVKASFEGTVFYTDFASTKLMNAIGESVKYFEEKMPWPDIYKRTNFGAVPAANSVIVALGSGDSGTQPPIGINLPNDEQIRQIYGTKSVSLYNILETHRKVNGDKITKEFYLPESVDLIKKYGDNSDDLHTALHEVCGHASGKTIVKDPDNCLKEYARAWEEARAELVGLYHSFDPVFYEKKLYSRQDVEKMGQAGYIGYATSDLLQLRRIPGPEIQDDHMRAMHFIVTYLMDEEKVIKPVVVNGKTYMTVPDFNKMKEAVGRLLAIVMEVKANGNYEKAKEMINKYGVKVNTAWQKEIQARYKALDLPLYKAFVYPQYELVKNAKGKVIDVKAVYKEGITAQMLRFAGYSKEAIAAALKAEKSVK